MDNSNVTIIDYGMGNTWSVINALRYLGSNPRIGTTPEDISSAGSLVLPGVGSFRKAMSTLRKTGLDKAIIESVQKKGKKILGICLGLQLMGTQSSEDGETEGLGLISAPVDRFTVKEVSEKKIPHIGFNQVISETDTILFNGLPQLADFYFVHSYRMLDENLNGKRAICEYGKIKFLAAYENDNIYATQFHPEKSQSNGLMLLRNFLLQ